jgi:hypothetical protein
MFVPTRCFVVVLGYDAYGFNLAARLLRHSTTYSMDQFARSTASDAAAATANNLFYEVSSGLHSSSTRLIDLYPGP